MKCSDVSALTLFPILTVDVFQFFGMSAASSGVGVGEVMMRFPP
jgi:hypothetical protein